MRYSVVLVLALVCVSSALTVERLQKNAAVIRGQLASKAGAKTTRLTICRTDGRSPEVLAESGGFCPRQTVPPQVIEEFYNTKRNNPQEWNEFFKAHEAGNFKYIVSYSSNCAFTSVADYEYFYQVDIDVEDISNDPVIKGLTNNIQTSTTTIFRGVDQNGGGHFEWDSFGCIPVKYVTNYRKAKINPKYKKDSTVPEERLMYLTEKQANGGSGTVLVYDPPVTINWNTYADKLSTKAPTPPPVGLTTQEVTSQLNEMLTKRKAYEPLAHGTAKGCTSASECANSQTPRCCFFPPTSWGSICSEAAGTRAGGLTCLDRPVAGDTVALCTKDQDCSANKSATKCCYRPSSGTVAGVGVCTVPETNAFKKADFLKKCKDVPNGYTLPPVSTARLSGF